MDTDPTTAHAGSEWPASRETTWGLIAVSAGLVLGITPAQVVPILLGAAVDSGLSLAWAGGLVTAELGALAFASWWFGSNVNAARVASWLPAAFVGIAVLHGFSAAIGDLPWLPALLGVRIGVGLTEGFVVASVYATIAGFAHAQALYGRALQLVILLSVVLLPVLAALGRFGLLGPYLGLAGLATILMVVFSVARRRAAAGGAPVVEAPIAPGNESSFEVPTWAGVLGAVGAGLVAFGDGLVYAFVQRIGSEIGLGSSIIGALLAASSLCGAAGAGLARRWTRGARIGLSLGVLATMAAALLVTIGPRVGDAVEVELSSPAGLLFAAGVLAKGASYFFVVTLILGVVAYWSRAGDADDRGWAPTVGGLIPLFASLGPLAGAAVVGALDAGYGLLGVGSAMASLAGLVLLWPGTGAGLPRQAGGA